MKTVEIQEYHFETSTDAYEKEMFPLILHHDLDLNKVEIHTFEQLLDFLEAND